MKKGFNKLHKLICEFMVFVFVLLLFPYQAEKAGGTVKAAGFEAADTTVDISADEIISYNVYYALHKDSGADTTDYITLNWDSEPTVYGGKPEILKDYNDCAGNSIKLTETQDISWRFSVSQPGFYFLRFYYCPAEGTGSSIERRILLDGSVPFREADSITLDRIWQNDDKSPEYDIQGNQLVISQVEAPDWRTQYVEDPTGYVGTPLCFYLSAGEHTLTVAGKEEPVILNSAEFCPATAENTKPYAEISAEYEKNNFKRVSDGTVITLQGQDAAAKSSQTLSPVSDTTSPTVTPYDYARIRYNAIGGSQWTNIGQWIEWRFYAPESGRYALSAHFKQSEKTDCASVREIRIDGTIPFNEAKNWMFPYDGSWQSAFFADENGTPYEFYLVQGWHTVNLRVTLGKYSDMLKYANTLLEELNMIYREIIVITGVSPDVYRDYRLDETIPETIEKIKALGEELEAFEDRILDEDASATNITEIKSIYELSDRMIRDSANIPKLLSSYKDAISAFGTWINGRLSNPLELDWLCFSSAEYKLPKGEAGFFGRLAHYIKQFISSFYMDYSAIGQTENKTKESLVAWIMTGRDQAQLLRQCALSSFTPNTDIAVDVQLVTQNALLPAILAKKGPDVVLGVSQDLPVNLALRNALVDLSQFEGIEKIKEQFYPSALVPFEFSGGLYALPETQTFPMLFYRKDILKQLGISTDDLSRWDTLLGSVLPKLQKDSLSFGMAHSYNNYFTINFQHGGSIYDEEKRISMLSDENAVDSMEFYSMLYTQYNLPIVFDFANRFRTGEIPVAVADYTMYNTLVMFAPEIKGMWGMLPVPGTLNSSGTVDYSAASAVTGTVILSTSKNTENAWEFLKWWVSEETQTRFGQGLESIIGAAARYNTANRGAMRNMQWNDEMRGSIMRQAEQLKGVPEVPGGYITTRMFDFAFRRIVYDGESVRETLNDTVYDINHELANKRREYNLD